MHCQGTHGVATPSAQNYPFPTYHSSLVEWNKYKMLQLPAAAKILPLLTILIVRAPSPDIWSSSPSPKSPLSQLQKSRRSPHFTLHMV